MATLEIFLSKYFWLFLVSLICLTLQNDSVGDTLRWNVWTEQNWSWTETTRAAQKYCRTVDENSSVTEHSTLRDPNILEGSVVVSPVLGWMRIWKKQKWLSGTTSFRRLRLGTNWVSQPMRDKGANKKGDRGEAAHRPVSLSSAASRQKADKADDVSTCQAPQISSTHNTVGTFILGEYKHLWASSYTCKKSNNIILCHSAASNNPSTTNRHMHTQTLCNESVIPACLPDVAQAQEQRNPDTATMVCKRRKFHESRSKTYWVVRDNIIVRGMCVSVGFYGAVMVYTETPTMTLALNHDMHHDLLTLDHDKYHHMVTYTT